jgi:hypothetical protein
VQINWKHIRTLNGAQSEGFEEFCTQLARRESVVTGSVFTRKGKPDAGIECYWTLPTGDELGWQAKYFSSLDNAQWSQLDDSVRTALVKHPRLIQYCVCVPTDLPDARLAGQTSAYQKWLDHVEKWSGWATDKSMSVDFIWWGSHEMLHRLALPANAGLARFWFDAAVFDLNWFENRLQESISTAGPRYSPEVNVDLPIIQEFDAFGRTAAWVTRLKKHAASISKAARMAGYDSNKLGEHKKQIEEILQSAEIVTAMIRDTRVEPTGPLSFTSLIERMESVQSGIKSASPVLSNRERAEDEKPRDTKEYSYRENPFRSVRFRLYDLNRALEDAVSTFKYTEKVARSAFLILDGTAGMGKTHLLCDVATKRLRANLPTILLMGQRFLQPGDPWTQALQQLDLSRLSAAEFIGCLEAAAQASNARALLMIDALNEGAGRSIWPNHLSAFLQLAARSPWVSVVVSVRTSYEGLVLPAAVSETATRVSHSGFADHEFDAAKTFFQHYGIELPSTPLLAPEYRSPLFLKTMCVGLKHEGHTRLPRGFHGISQIFRLYTNAINRKLAESLDFDPRSQLVQMALQRVVSAFPSHDTQWLSREDSLNLVNSILPNRSFHNSLYQGLVGEGLLVEDFIRLHGHGECEFVHLGYGRLADHLTAEVLLSACLQRNASEMANTTELTGQDDRISSGVLESLFVQAPETLKQELTDFAPSILKHWQWPEAFRQSLIWREPGAFTKRTLHWFNESIDRESDGTEALEVVLTLASVPDHPWNALFLDRQLRKRSMPDRDQWWSIKLHYLYAERQSAPHRIIDWALSVKQTDRLDKDVVRLISSTLAWMFSSSNRFLRDRATKANVNLLTGREDAAAELVRSFGEVDDLYIRERVLAVAYGVAMRSCDAARIQELADAVLATVFTTAPVVPHLLLRDYARGVVERSHLSVPLPDETMQRVRPPYGSKWPRIPSEKTIKKLKESFDADNKDMHGARRIAFSVLDDDFARYVIGTNSWSTDWLSVRLGQSPWRSYEELIQEFGAGLNPSIRPAWDAYNEAMANLRRVVALQRITELRDLIDAGDAPDEDLKVSLAAAKDAVDHATTTLLDQLNSEQARLLEEILHSRTGSSDDRPPQFDLRLMQRYILKRVFGLGWTTNRFEYFDTRVIHYMGREAAKAERIGKKYQWISYHEVCAFVADNFQFRAGRGMSDHDEKYEGPWQDFFRDIDPSHSLLNTAGDAESKQSWWAPQFEPDWGDGVDGKSWAEEFSEFPLPVALLTPKDSEGQSWMVADLSFDRRRPIPEGMDREDIEARSLWCHLRGFLVRTDDVAAFLEWAEGVDFWGQWMPQVPSSHGMFLGEYLWSPAWKHFNNAYYENEGWVQPGHDCPVLVRTAAFEYHQESSGFDCSVDSGFTLHLPDEELANCLNLRWSGQAGDFRNPNGELVATDPSAFSSGPPALLLRREFIEELAHTKGLSICWTVLGEKLAYVPGPMKRLGEIHVSGACALKDGRVEGFVHFIKDGNQQELYRAILATKRF